MNTFTITYIDITVCATLNYAIIGREGKWKVINIDVVLILL